VNVVWIDWSMRLSCLILLSSSFFSFDIVA
jgi:hypothetical protein